MNNIDLNLQNLTQINDIEDTINDARENETNIEEKIIKNQNIDNFDSSDIDFSDIILKIADF